MYINKNEIYLIDIALEQLYPAAECSLRYDGEGWKLLVMGRLSAQCTDERVNAVCVELFEKFPTAAAMADGDLSEIERIVKPCGLYHGKSKNIKDACAMLVGEYGGVLPSSIDELLKFPGVGRKIANLLLGDLFDKGGIVADTHCMRICGRFGAYDEELRDPVKIERILTPLIEQSRQSDFCHRLVLFGRETCTSRSPKCSECALRKLCKRGRAASGAD